MDQVNTRKRQQPFEMDNFDYALTAELAKVKEENKSLEEKLGNAEQKAQMAKNEVRTIYGQIGTNQ